MLINKLRNNNHIQCSKWEFEKSCSGRLVIFQIPIWSTVYLNIIFIPIVTLSLATLVTDHHVSWSRLWPCSWWRLHVRWQLCIPGVMVSVPRMCSMSHLICSRPLHWGQLQASFIAILSLYAEQCTGECKIYILHSHLVISQFHIFIGNLGSHHLIYSQ